MLISKLLHPLGRLLESFASQLLLVPSWLPIMRKVTILTCEMSCDLLNPRPYLLFRHPRLHLGRGHPRLVCPSIEIELRNKDKRKDCDVFESNHTQFYYLRSHFDPPRAGQTNDVVFWEKIKFFFANNYRNKKDRVKRETPSYSSHPGAP